jgi:hypothetical protein
VEIKEVAQLLLYCLMVGSFASFLQEAYKGILKRYHLWLVYHWIKNWKKKDRYKRQVLKPLGLCQYCQGTWIHILICPLVFNLDIWCLLSLGGTYLVIKALDKSFK